MINNLLNFFRNFLRQKTTKTDSNEVKVDTKNQIRPKVNNLAYWSRSTIEKSNNQDIEPIQTFEEVNKNPKFLADFDVTQSEERFGPPEWINFSSSTLNPIQRSTLPKNQIDTNHSNFYSIKPGPIKLAQKSFSPTKVISRPELTSYWNLFSNQPRNYRLANVQIPQKIKMDGNTKNMNFVINNHMNLHTNHQNNHNNNNSDRPMPKLPIDQEESEYAEIGEPDASVTQEYDNLKNNNQSQNISCNNQNSRSSDSGHGKSTSIHRTNLLGNNHNLVHNQQQKISNSLSASKDRLSEFITQRLPTLNSMGSCNEEMSSQMNNSSFLNSMGQFRRQSSSIQNDEFSQNILSPKLAQLVGASHPHQFSNLSRAASRASQSRNYRLPGLLPTAANNHSINHGNFLSHPHVSRMNSFTSNLRKNPIFDSENYLGPKIYKKANTRKLSKKASFLSIHKNNNNTLRDELSDSYLISGRDGKRKRCCSFQFFMSFITLILVIGLIGYFVCDRFYPHLLIFHQKPDFPVNNTEMAKITFSANANLIQKSTDSDDKSLIDLRKQLNNNQKYITRLESLVKQNTLLVSSQNVSLSKLENSFNQANYHQSKNLTKFNEILEKLFSEMEGINKDKLRGPKGENGKDGAIGMTGPRGSPGIQGKDGKVGPPGIQGLPGVPGINGRDGRNITIIKTLPAPASTQISGPNMTLCYHDKQEKIAVSGVDYMHTGWIRPKRDFVFTGITCSTDGRRESFLEVSRLRRTDSQGNDKTVKQFRCMCGSAPGDIPNRLRDPHKKRDRSTLTSCSIHYWSCPVK